MTVEGGGVLHVTDHAVSGPVLVALRPSAIALHTARPEGSARNVWPGVVDGVEALGERVRVSVAGAPSVLVDVTPGAVADLHVASGDAGLALGEGDRAGGLPGMTAAPRRSSRRSATLTPGRTLGASSSDGTEVSRDATSSGPAARHGRRPTAPGPWRSPTTAS